jgi:N6-adenosine-specific RNA methylase IME4
MNMGDGREHVLAITGKWFYRIDKITTTMVTPALLPVANNNAIADLQIQDVVDASLTPYQSSTSHACQC